MLFFIGNADFMVVQANIFKYISCYSLSRAAYQAKFEPIRFKYISCYSLSGSESACSGYDLYLNTSHVILYQAVPSAEAVPSAFKYISCYSLSVSQPPARMA